MSQVLGTGLVTRIASWVAGVPMPGTGERSDMPGLADLNALPAQDFEELLLRCCAAPGWARRVTRGRPYSSLADLLGVAAAAWAARDPGDLDAAMAGHPRIGERRLSGWSAHEQAGVQAGAGADGATTLTALADGNAAYEQRFGHVFLICATGRGPAEILAELNRRMSNDPATEREVAAAEIGKINDIRLRKLVAA
jgi:2-oxo-4-hydroxy-4-carboxy-5-ureidoimidazoline decarboxylase